LYHKIAWFGICCGKEVFMCDISCAGFLLYGIMKRTQPSFIEDRMTLLHDRILRAQIKVDCFTGSLFPQQ